MVISDLSRLLRSDLDQPDNRVVLADALEEIGYDLMAENIRAGRPVQTFLRGTILVVAARKRGMTYGVWLDGTPAYWAGPGPWSDLFCRTDANGSPVELCWGRSRQNDVIAKMEAMEAMYAEEA